MNLCHQIDQVDETILRLPLCTHMQLTVANEKKTMHNLWTYAVHLKIPRKIDS